SAISAKERLNLGIVNFITTSAAGTPGSLLGGILLDWFLAAHSGHPVTAFRWYFFLLLIFFFFILFLIQRLENPDARKID
ncbi:MAG: hypothetical protein AB1798_19705, partial [Spirochaetota bacterium]